MQLLKITIATYLDEYKIKLQFNNSIKGTVDFKQKIFNEPRAIFKPLQQINYFKNFKQNGWTIEWKNGLDIAPEYLLNLLLNQQKKANKPCT